MARRRAPRRRFGVEALEEEAGDPVVDRVSESAHPSRAPEGAVPLGPHLGQPTRLVLGRHQEDVGARHELVLEVSVKPVFVAHRSGMAGADASVRASS